MNKELKNSIYEINSSDFGRCLEPNKNCKNKASDAHSIQNSRIFDLLEKDGHLVSFKIKTDCQLGPYLDFDLNVGRNKASTFKGLCNKHDSEIFKEIEDKPLDLANNSKQLFLFAYRAVLKEMHAVTLSALRTQSAYKKQIELGLLPKNEPSNFGIWAVDWLSNSYLMHLYKKKFDKAYLTNSFKKVQHDLVVLKNQAPTIAASSLYSLDHVQVRDDIARVALTIFPASKSKTYVLFSYLDYEAPKAREELKNIFFAGPLGKRKLISKMVLRNCENFFIAPEYFQTWNSSKKELVKNYFNDTIDGQDVNVDNSRILLF
jgi:hypothetical protein